MTTALRHVLLAGAALALPLAPLAAQDDSANQEIVVTAKPIFGEFGVDLSARDVSVNPGDDFERYASGAWIDRTEIPSDQSSTGSFIDLALMTEKQMRPVIQEAPATSKAGAMYRSFMDAKRVERVGMAPLMRDVATIRAIADKSEMARFMGTTDGNFGRSLFDFYVDLNPDTPGMQLLNVTQGGLGLPERDYYLNKDFAPQREAYRLYLQRTFKAIGTPDPVSAAADVLEFETYVAQLSWTPADSRNIDLTTNRYSPADLATYAPGLDWAAFFEGMGTPQQAMLIASQNTAIQKLAQLYDRTPLETLKLWQQFHIADDAAPYMHKAMVDSRFEYLKTVSGVTAQRDRWKRGVTLVNSQLGEVVGQAYVDKHFPAASKAKMQALVGNLKLAMADRIRGNSWMSEPTKEAALAKLANLNVMVGYPDKWKDYSALEVDPGDLYGNVVRARRVNHAMEMAKVGAPVDRQEWFMAPQTVNAYNGGQRNEIVFPAAILQAPFFDPAADSAVNYGAIGVVIGHEIIHSFDDQGRKIDAEGRIRDWWTAEDGERFKAKAKDFGAQYAAIEIAGTHVDPELTMGENIADFAGLEIAYDGYMKSLAGKEPPVIDGLTGPQRFFLGYAQVWRSKDREDSLKSQIASDPHAPARLRTIVPIRNMEEWYAAFNIGPDSKFYIPPEKRVVIW